MWFTEHMDYINHGIACEPSEKWQPSIKKSMFLDHRNKITFKSLKVFLFDEVYFRLEFFFRV